MYYCNRFVNGRNAIISTKLHNIYLDNWCVCVCIYVIAKKKKKKCKNKRFHFFFQTLRKRMVNGVGEMLN